MFKELINKATRNIWCNPFMDRPSILVPKRIAPKEGIKRHMELPWNILYLPDQQERFYLFQIGNIPDRALGLLQRYENWTTLSDVMVDNELTANLYLTDGVEFMRNHVYIKRGMGGVLFLAIKHYSYMPDPRADKLYLRLYQNSFRESSRSSGIDKLIYAAGGLMDHRDTILEVLNDYYDRKDSGYVWLKHNGLEYGHFSPGMVTVGDSLEFVQDLSVKKVLDFKVSELPTFVSELDSKAKYLLHQPVYDNPTIDYYDDIDILLIDKTFGGEGNYRGVRYHNNALDSIRMVTHQDYSIPVNYIEEFIADNPDILNMDNLTIRLIIRHSGYDRPLDHNASKTHELYKLSDEEILEAMVGFGGVIGEWRAEKLEASEHVSLYSKQDELTISDVTKGYGYDSIMVELFSSPIPGTDDGGELEFKLPVGLRSNSTIYEYDGDGVMLGQYDITSNRFEYYPLHPECARIEGFRGKTTTSPDYVVGEVIQPLDPERNYRFYLLTVAQPSGLTGEWIEAVIDEHYRIEDSIVRWDVDPRLRLPLVVSDTEALGYTTILRSTEQVLRHRVVRYEDGRYLPLELPMGNLTVWLNGHCLIAGLDYVLNDGTEIVIINKEYLVAAADQSLTLRWSGHIEDKLPEDHSECGVVKQGMLSANNKFDIRDDRLSRVVVRGKVLQPDMLEYAEDHSGVLVEGVMDGSPYTIEYYQPPHYGLGIENISEFKSDSLSLNIRLSALLSSKLPQPTFPPFITVDRAYVLYSVFISAVLEDMKNGNIRIEHGALTEKELVSLAQPYLPLLDMDPTLIDLPFTKELVAIHPHRYMEDITVTLYEYQTLERLSLKYLNGLVDMTQHVRIGGA
jgi:hypothetical protein